MKEIYTWSAILAIVFASVVGDVLLARAMKQVGDVGDLRRRAGLGVVACSSTTLPLSITGVAWIVWNSSAPCWMRRCRSRFATSDCSLLFALSWGDVSLVAPAAASLTFIGNAVAAKIFLHERVDQRRWIAVVLVAAGVALLAG